MLTNMLPYEARRNYLSSKVVLSNEMRKAKDKSRFHLFRWNHISYSFPEAQVESSYHWVKGNGKIAWGPEFFE